jgi:anhydro-N-acetylmuramic acid kinase
VTREAIARVRESLPALPLLWLLAGEEEQSAPLLETLSGLFPEPVHRAADMGWPAGHFEAEAFAYLAVRSLRRLPLTFPGTTGVKQPITGGRLARAPRR